MSKTSFRFGKKNKQEFLSLIDENQGIIHKISRMYCDSDLDREDLFQEILIQLWKSYTNFKGESKFSTWMYRVALNTAITFFRKQKRSQNVDSLDKVCHSLAADHKEENDRVSLLYRAIATLNESDKALIMLHLDDYNYDEIADIVGISKTNVGVRLHRIKSKLQKMLEGKA